MDPQAVWERMLSALSEGDWEDAVDSAGDLREWLSRGGFPPQISPGRTLPESWCRTVARAACDAVLEEAGRNGA